MQFLDRIFGMLRILLPLIISRRILFSNPPQVLSDIANGVLANVSSVSQPRLISDHPATSTGGGRHGCVDCKCRRTVCVLAEHNVIVEASPNHPTLRYVWRSATG